MTPPEDPMTIPTQGEDLVLVPREPTEAMLIAARDWSYRKYGKPIGNDAAQGCYRAMISASPSREEGGNSPSQTSPSCPQMGNETQSPFVWRDISSAPRDGTDVLLWAPWHRVMMGRWGGLGAYSGPQWYTSWYHVPLPDSTPTHWAPVPEAPR